MKETLSALMDAELEIKERRRALDAVADDDELRAAWGRYHMARAVLRGEWDGEPRWDLSTRVLAALAEGESGAAAQAFWGPLGRHRGRQALRFALAASLTAAAALFALRMAVVATPAPSGTPMQTALSAPLPTPPQYVERAHWQGPQWRRRLNAFLLEHSAVAPLAGINGLSYVRLAAYNGPPSRGAQNKP
ncbi:sigma-E factor negative regulatory protein [Acidiferrobacter sp.]|uniref:sigma-E factor negative regulatory protein n=1 Tax=Acidiferrobacter sp. TaxID=1872107 RepID=UPI0026017196|nr:sigma-E factor negative regulatory protein [Acidiferrobacter sp.]